MPPPRTLWRRVVRTPPRDTSPWILFASPPAFPPCNTAGTAFPRRTRVRRLSRALTPRIRTRRGIGGKCRGSRRSVSARTCPRSRVRPRRDPTARRTTRGDASSSTTISSTTISSTTISSTSFSKTSSSSRRPGRSRRRRRRRRSSPRNRRRRRRHDRACVSRRRHARALSRPGPRPPRGTAWRTETSPRTGPASPPSPTSST